MNIEAELAAQFVGAAEVHVALDKFAHEVAEYAKSIAPVFGDRPPHRDAPKHGAEGDYRDSIHVEPVRVGALTRRVITRDFKAIWIELGSSKMPEYAVFAKTAAYFGGTGPVIDEGVQAAQGTLREELEKYAKLTAVGAAAEEIAAQGHAVSRARYARSAAFRAARRNALRR